MTLAAEAPHRWADQVGNYVNLWKQIDSRLSVAFHLLSASDPDAALAIGQPFHEWLAHNELELALDELMSVLDDGRAIPPRRFLEETLVAAMLMRLRRQFTLITSKIVDLGPHTFGSSSNPPHLCCDFNGFVEPDVYLLDSVCTALDAARLKLLPAPALRVVLYDDDLDDNGCPTWMLVDADLSEHARYGIVARAIPSSYRSVRRQHGGCPN